MNTKAMLELAEHLERMPENQFNINMFVAYHRGQFEDIVTLTNHCGTTCCIAGEKVLLDGGYVEVSEFGSLEVFKNKSGETICPAVYSEKELDLSFAQAQRLFYDYSLESSLKAASKIRKMVEEHNNEIETITNGIEDFKTNESAL